MTIVVLPRSTILAIAELAEAQRDLAFALLLPGAPDEAAAKMKASGSLIGMERAIRRVRQELIIKGEQVIDDKESVEKVIAHIEAGPDADVRADLVRLLRRLIARVEL